VVIGLAFLGSAWTLFSGVGSFRNVGIDRSNAAPQLANIDIALGAIYLTVALIEAFGVFSAVSQRLALVRIYALLSAFTTVAILAAGLVRVVAHFVFKNEMISQCTTLTQNDEIVYYGFFGPVGHHTIEPDEAARWCQEAWDHDSWSEIIAMLVTSGLALFFTAVVFSYYRQLLDPSSPANAARLPPSSSFPNSRFPPAHYAPAYGGENASVPNLGYAAPEYEPGKPPGYARGGYLGESGDTKEKSADGGERDVTSPGGRVYQ